MSEAEDFDELPQITVNTSMSDDISTFVMPSAEVLATKRAREEQCERELVALRRVGDVTLAHSDSSGSEGELAAAVTALRVAPPPRAARPHPALLLHALRPHLAPPVAAALPEHLDVPEMVRHIAEALGGDESWGPEEVGVAGAVLLAALGSASPGPRPRRALHALLDEHGDDELVQALAGAVVAALPDPHTLLRVSDACRSGARRGADALADALVWRALDDTLEAGGAVRAGCAGGAAALGAAAGAWRGVSAARRYVCAQLAGRALATCPPPAPPALLAALAPPPAAPPRPADLQVVVFASKLRLLFRSEK